jgi:hypothetical protein
MKIFQEAVKSRRSIYKLGKNIPVLQSEIIAAVERMTKDTPSPFHMQSARVVVTMLDHHENVWHITKGELKSVLPPLKFAEVEPKINSFAEAYGTILFFESSNMIKAMQDQFPEYRDNFPGWAMQANGMLQFAIWTALEDMGLGANLQHYNPIIDEPIRQIFDLPDSWDLTAQLVFGEKLEDPEPLYKVPTGTRVKIFREI